MSVQKNIKRQGRLKSLSLLAALSVVTACGLVTPSEDRIVFDGIAFKAKAKPVNKKVSPADFNVVVKGVSASLDGAREAGRYEGIKFCIAGFGSSRIKWKVGPDTDPQKLLITDDELTFSGTCQRP